MIIECYFTTIFVGDIIFLQHNGDITCRAFWLRKLLLPERNLAKRAAYTRAKHGQVHVVLGGYS